VARILLSPWIQLGKIHGVNAIGFHPI